MSCTRARYVQYKKEKGNRFWWGKVALQIFQLIFFQVLDMSSLKNGSNACLCHSFPDLVRHPGAVSVLYWLSRASCIHCLQRQRDIFYAECSVHIFKAGNAGWTRRVMPDPLSLSSSTAEALFAKLNTSPIRNIYMQWIHKLCRSCEGKHNFCWPVLLASSLLLVPAGGHLCLDQVNNFLIPLTTLTQSLLTIKGACWLFRLLIVLF